MYLNPDCVIENNAVSIMHNRITSTKELNYIGMLEEPDLSFVLPETTLYKTIQIIWYNRKISNTHPPSGRFIALRKEIFPKFPEIHSEDTWASLYSYKNYGPQSIMVIKEPTVKYIPYKNWVDFMKVESRYMEGTYEVYAKYPGYKELYNKRATESKISDEKKLELMKSFCEDHNIDFKILRDIKDVIFPLVIENAKLMRQIGESGTWKLIK